MAKITIEAYKCERCGHIWAPRKTTKEEPKVCPKCKNPYWNKPKKK
jgi:rubrerythrin